MNMKQSCKALICAIEGELDGRHCTEEQAAAILDHALPSLTETLARVEAERNEVCDGLDRQTARLIAAQAQLAEAVGLLRKVVAWPEEECTYGQEQVQEAARTFLARHAQGEQQEAQGAQAGDERAGFKKEYDAFRQWAGSRLTARQLDLDEVGLFYDEIAGFAHDAWQARAALATQPAATDGVVYVEVSGLTGTGKSAVAGEIEVAMLALGLEVQWIEGDSEKRLNHADFAGELELYRPRVEIRERNIARPAVRGAEHE